MAEDDRRSQSLPAVVGRVIGKVIKGADMPASPDPGERPALRPPQAVQVKGKINADEYDAMGRAKQIVVDAEERAREILNEALAKRDSEYAKAREEAHAEVAANAAAELAKAKMQAGQIIAGAENEIL